MNIQEIRLFADVATQGSFASAAKIHNMDPSSVSRAIASLEASLNLRLFQRTTRRLSLTEAGETYLAKVVPLIDELDRVSNEAKNIEHCPAGILRISASVTFGQTYVLPLISRFRELYPNIQLECLFTDTPLDLVAERIDLAIRLAPTIQGNLVITKLFDTQYRVVASPEYLRKHTAIQSPCDLSNHECILFNLKQYQSGWHFLQGDNSLDVPITGKLTLSPASSIRQATLLGLGPSLLPNWLIDDDINEGKLINCLPQWRVTATTFDTAAWIVYPSRSYLPHKVRVMIDFLKTHVNS